jgi:predicted dehydrogenase
MSGAKSRPLGWGLIGCGDIAAKRVAAALRDAPDSCLVSVSRARAELLPAFAKEHGARRFAADWRDILRDDEIDAVYLATPVALHAEQAVAAAKAGKHVLCEKPMALDVHDCERMIAAAKDNDVRLGVAYYRHHYPTVARVRALLTSGEIGQPLLAHAEAFSPFNPTAEHPRAWLLRKDLSGGGPMADFGCHRIEVLLDLLGPVASSRGFPTKARFKEREVEDTCVAHLSFESGAQAMVSVTHAALEQRDSVEVIGTLGSARIPILNEGLLRITTAAGTRDEQHPPHANLHQPLIDDFVAAVREKRDSTVTGVVGLEVQRILDAIYGVTPASPLKGASAGSEETATARA